MITYSIYERNYFDFRMDSNEKWVATRLRMILFKMRGDIDSFQLIEGKNQKTLKNKLRKKSKSSNILTQNKKQSPKTQTPQKKQVKGKLTLEERQLNKLRQQTYQETKLCKNILLSSSKLAYLKAHGLEPNIICL